MRGKSLTVRPTDTVSTSRKTLHIQDSSWTTFLMDMASKKDRIMSSKASLIMAANREELSLGSKTDSTMSIEAPSTMIFSTGSAASFLLTLATMAVSVTVSEKAKEDSSI